MNREPKTEDIVNDMQFLISMSISSSQVIFSENNLSVEEP